MSYTNLRLDKELTGIIASPDAMQLEAGREFLQEIYQGNGRRHVHLRPYHTDICVDSFTAMITALTAGERVGLSVEPGLRMKARAFIDPALLAKVELPNEQQPSESLQCFYILARIGFKLQQDMRDILAGESIQNEEIVYLEGISRYVPVPDSIASIATDLRHENSLPSNNGQLLRSLVSGYGTDLSKFYGNPLLANKVLIKEAMFNAIMSPDVKKAFIG